ncbi:type III secretion system cytoplasmic ring protein SctQ [Bradyrhizobium sp. LHD-71]|uniref:type III secretion system cytoplasmic ring protein SctQ n=1 Tax=Bradyrhizobium sp. LHD-71 TaxID=3072141 RepID=UPI00280F98F6|nr:type III secretion system cytoplasmic ring protein SctQ [Bradyrhizobium sp. LHD-71]MDQ8726881.1 type III secretion system cytoplasmic ring protein SctQ [Bradyrhizobium sp. LHD-71]
MTSARRALGLHREPRQDADVTPWHPQTIYDQPDLAVLNACSVRRGSFKGLVEGLPIEFDLSPIHATRSPAANLDFEAIVSWGEASARVRLACANVLRLLDLIEPGLSEDLPGEPTLSLLIELALAPLFAKIERSSGTSLAVRSPSRRASNDPAASDPRSHWLVFHGKLDGTPFELVFEFDGRAFESFAALLQHAASARRPLAETSAPIIALFSAGTVRLPVRVLQDLHHGDVLIPDEFPFERGEVVLTFGHRYQAIAHLKEDGAQVRSALQRIKFVQEINTMEAKSAPRAVETELGDLEIQLTFELGRQIVELDQLRTIAPGYVFPLGRSPDDPVDIVANGRRIGRGEIVRVGDGLGVRLIRLFDHG